MLNCVEEHSPSASTLLLCPRLGDKLALGTIILVILVVSDNVWSSNLVPTEIAANAAFGALRSRWQCGMAVHGTTIYKSIIALIVDHVAFPVMEAGTWYTSTGMAVSFFPDGRSSYEQSSYGTRDILAPTPLNATGKQ